MTYNELTKDLSERNAQALILGPIFVGGDSVDMEVFIEDYWKLPVTDENIKLVIKAFKAWYAAVAPDEYHEPEMPVIREW